MATSSNPSTSIGGKSSIRIAVIGDPGSGKSSLIKSAADNSFPDTVSPVLPPTLLPAEFYPDGIPLTIIDTPSGHENWEIMLSECQVADAIVLTYACDCLSALDQLSTYWLQELRRLNIKVPIVVVGCKLDLKDGQKMNLEQMMSPIMQQFREIETCMECSALKQIQVQEVFYYAQKAVLHPTTPLYDKESQSLKPSVVRALETIFNNCDHDRDGALSDTELNDFQVRFFNGPLQSAEIVGIKNVVKKNVPDGVNENGLTLAGFLFLHALFIEKDRAETTWTVLRKFGFDNEINLRDDLLPSTFEKLHDQSRADTKPAKMESSDEDEAEARSIKIFKQTSIEKAVDISKGAKIIGEGGFGVVYKCKIGGKVVAIKILKPDGMHGSKQFRQEVTVLGELNHVLLVKLIGICYDNRALVYEYVENGSVASYMEEKPSGETNKPSNLPWQLRTRIVYQICLALNYIHSRPEPLVHGDIKPDNILLDENMNVKLADFGMCRFLPAGTASKVFVQASTVGGTEDYIDPEYRATGILSPKCDVYSFGITILKILTRKHTATLYKNMRQACRNGTVMDMVDLCAGEWNMDVAKNLAYFGVMCCSSKKDRMKYMKEMEKDLGNIVRLLEG